MPYEVDDLGNGTPPLPTGLPAGTTHLGVTDPFLPGEVPPTKVAPPELPPANSNRVGNPRFAAFSVTVLLGAVAPILPEDPNRSFFKLVTVVPNSTSTVYMGPAGQLANGYGWPVGTVPTGNTSNGTDETFTTTAPIFAKLIDTANGGAGTPGETATVYVYVEYAS